LQKKPELSIPLIPALTVVTRHGGDPGDLPPTFFSKSHILRISAP